MAFSQRKVGIYRLWIAVYESHANRWEILSNTTAVLSGTSVIAWTAGWCYSTDATFKCITQLQLGCWVNEFRVLFTFSPGTRKEKRGRRDKYMYVWWMHGMTWVLHNSLETKNRDWKGRDTLDQHYSWSLGLPYSPFLSKKPPSITLFTWSHHADITVMHCKNIVAERENPYTTIPQSHDYKFLAV